MITPEQFMAQPTDPDEDLETEPQAGQEVGQEVGPLESIADSLRRLVVRIEQHDADEAEEDHQRDLVDQLDRELAEKQALIEKVLEVCKPSVSKLANQIREVLEPPAPVVEPADEPDADVVYTCPHCKTGWGERVDPCTECGRPSTAVQEPLDDAPVEEWRAFARSKGYQGPDVDVANRSQIRTMLGIAQPVAQD